MEDENANVDTFALSMGTCTEQGSYRENVLIQYIPLAIGKYRINSASNYFILQDDGDVLQDVYVLGECVDDFFVEVTDLDMVEKRAKGKFTVSFDREPTPEREINPNSESGAFRSGTFDVSLR